MLREWSVAEQRYRAVLEVLDGASVTEVARRYGVSRQTVHAWLRRYAEDGGVVNLDDRTSRPWSCPHQMDPVIESRVLTLRDEHPVWGPDRIRYELEQEARDGAVPVPSRSAIYRALVRGERSDPAKRKRRRADYRRWERGRPMELWQMDIVGGIHLADGVEVKCVSGIDDNSRYVISAKLITRATARPVCEALLEALERHGVPEQVLTDNGKVFTGRFGPRGTASEVLFDRICAENGIRHLLTAPRSPTTTGKVERLHKTMRAECFRIHDRRHATIKDLQAAVDAWVVEYNTRRPHQSLGMRPPAERFSLVKAPEPVTAIVPAPRPATTVVGHLLRGWRSRGRWDGSWARLARSGWRGSSTGCRWYWPGNGSNAWSRRTRCRSSTPGCWSGPTRNDTPRAAKAYGRSRSWSATTPGQEDDRSCRSRGPRCCGPWTRVGRSRSPAPPTERAPGGWAGRSPSRSSAPASRSAAARN